jgi:hypothetical protein
VIRGVGNLRLRLIDPRRPVDPVMLLRRGLVRAGVRL